MNSQQINRTDECLFDVILGFNFESQAPSLLIVQETLSEIGENEPRFNK